MVKDVQAAIKNKFGAGGAESYSDMDAMDEVNDIPKPYDAPQEKPEPPEAPEPEEKPEPKEPEEKPAPAPAARKGFSAEKIGKYKVPRIDEKGKPLMDDKGKPKFTIKVMAHDKAKKLGFKAADVDVNAVSSSNERVKKYRAAKRAGTVEAKTAQSEETALPEGNWITKFGVKMSEKSMKNGTAEIYKNSKGAAAFYEDGLKFHVMLQDGTRKTFEKERDASTFMQNYFERLNRPPLTKSFVLDEVDSLLQKAQGYKDGNGDI